MSAHDQALADAVLVMGLAHDVGRPAAIDAANRRWERAYGFEPAEPTVLGAQADADGM